MIGGEGEEPPKWSGDENVQIMQFASYFGATVMDLEHRFFGPSRPIKWAISIFSSTNLFTLISVPLKLLSKRDGLCRMDISTHGSYHNCQITISTQFSRFWTPHCWQHLGRQFNTALFIAALSNSHWTITRFVELVRTRKLREIKIAHSSRGEGSEVHCSLAWASDSRFYLTAIHQSSRSFDW